MIQLFLSLFNGKRILPLLLIIAFAVETFSVTYGLFWLNHIRLLSILYLIAGFIIAIGWLFLPQATLSFKNRAGITKRAVTRRILAIAVKSIILGYFSFQLFKNAPISMIRADMLPIMKVMATRFYHGQWHHVYDKIPEIYGGIQPIYLPAMWMPFTLSVALNIDMRWITVGGLFLGFTLFIILIKPFKKPFAVSILSIIAVSLLWWLIKEDLFNFLPLTEEGIVIGYYSLLVLALLNGNYWFIGFACALCMLSRYVFIGWLPAFAIYLLLNGKWRELLRATTMGLAVIITLFILPFGLKPLQLMMTLPGEYISFTKDVWHNSAYFFNETMGLAKFFGPTHIILQHYLLVILSFTLPTLFVCIVFWIKKKQPHRINNIPLAALKLTMVVFFNLVDVPFLYLFYTASFVSLIGMAYFVSIPSSHLENEEEVIYNE